MNYAGLLRLDDNFLRLLLGLQLIAWTWVYRELDATRSAVKGLSQLEVNQKGQL